MSISVNSNPFYERPTLAELQSRIAKSAQEGTLNKLEVQPITLDGAKAPNVDTFEYYRDDGLGLVGLYDKMPNSYLRNFHGCDYTHGAGYYGDLFLGSAEVVNDNLDRNIKTMSGNKAYTVELAVSRYEELRDEVFKAFGHDKTMLENNLLYLDKAFEWHLQDLAHTAAFRMKSEQRHAQIKAGEYGEQTKLSEEYEKVYVPHKLGASKDFNFNEFAKNVTNMISEFAQSYLKNVRSGLGYASARNNTLEYMLSAFGKTTSVNSLSFDDYKVVEKYAFDIKALGNVAMLNELNGRFNNSTELSAELRALLG